VAVIGPGGPESIAAEFFKNKIKIKIDS